jgi:hypothetical protein
MKKRLNVLKQNQNGMVSILVTMLIMLFLSVIIIGFAKFIQREQRQALDRQLSTQAFYAAETGINDAKNAINAMGAATIPPKPGCGNDANYTLNPTIDAATKTGYTCILINPAPGSLQYGNIDTSKSTVIPLVLSNPADTIANLTLSWQAGDGSTDFNCPDSAAGLPNAPDLTPTGGWTCGTGILRVDLVPFGAGVTRDNLGNSLFNAFLYPVSGGGTATAAYSGSKANMFKVTCTSGTTPKYCKFTITGVNTNRAYLRLKSVYINSSIDIAATVTSGGAASFVGTQVVIDSTGKANDVLRRIQVRIPLDASGILPDSPLDASGNICKRYIVTAGPTVSDPDGCGIN